jgi:hypothetical protein
MTGRLDGRWVLAFDADCGACKEISAIVSRECDGRLEVLPLTDPDVREWRRQALGPQPPWAPTLISHQPGRVRAWTGPGMGPRLARRLGVRRTGRVLGALGQLRRRHAPPGVDVRPAAELSLSRKGFLNLAAGVAVAGGVLFAGKTPAFAKANQATEAMNRWLATNRGRLPQRYDDLMTFPDSYRKAIWGQLNPSVRSQLWLERFARYRAAHPNLGDRQVAVLDEMVGFVGQPASFERDRLATVAPRMEALAQAAIEAFGTDEARELLTRLGPEPSADQVPTVALPDGTIAICSCSVESNWCVANCYHWTACDCNCIYSYCRGIGCLATTSGCGNFWSHPCDGRCNTCIGTTC